jgi:hypothetical protein
MSYLIEVWINDANEVKPTPRTIVLAYDGKTWDFYKFSNGQWFNYCKYKDDYYAVYDGTVKYWFYLTVASQPLSLGSNPTMSDCM